MSDIRVAVTHNALVVRSDDAQAVLVRPAQNTLALSPTGPPGPQGPPGADGSATFTNVDLGEFF